LRELAHAYSTRLGITVTADITPDAPDGTLDAKTKHTLLRIAQEALANAARHSGASLISLRLASDGAAVTLMVTDNGEGFAARDGDGRHGLGLRIMQERVEELHGTFDLTTARGQGTRIAVCLPVEIVND
jgi:signal transduction histidine kinase